MARKTVALSLDQDIYEQYQKYCEEYHMILSRKVESLMKKDLEGKRGKS
ncbi:hypothetical protein GOV09_06880 [Candidatus Woesearchaeota archaeon]|nr:hypothetical protein [Candidatus Woesearchaeota archaeon]